MSKEIGIGNSMLYEAIKAKLVNVSRICELVDAYGDGSISTYLIKASCFKSETKIKQKLSLFILL